MSSILMIEDEATLKDWFELAVRSFHRNLEWAKNSDEALKQMGDPTKLFDLIISDFNLNSKHTGLDLWRIAQIKCPETPFLLISAMPDHLFHEIVRTGESCPPFMLKPFTAHEFRQTLDSVLKSKAAQNIKTKQAA